MLPQDPDHVVRPLGAIVDLGIVPNVPIHVGPVRFHGGQNAAEVLELVGPTHSALKGVAVQVQCVVGVVCLARALLVPSLDAGRNASRPREAEVPILVSHDREVGVLPRRVRIVADDGQDLVTPQHFPRRVVLGQDRRNVHPIAVVEVVVVVHAVAEVDPGIKQFGTGVGRAVLVVAMRLALAPTVVDVAAAGKEAAPRLVEDEGRLGAIDEPHLEAVCKTLDHFREVRFGTHTHFVRDRD
mmetsp:Transcript_90760/g.177592  ORF Transcript_90760/g.177592 Transcript_90760/m.177592 type:complete len:241 (+) Transcript_90760:304-1026(+)